MPMGYRGFAGDDTSRGESEQAPSLSDHRHSGYHARGSFGNNLNPFLSAVAAFVLALAGAPAFAQQLEPRAYSNLPVGLNFLIAGYAYSQGDVLLDPSLPVTDAHSKVNALVLGYVRSLDFWGNSGSIGLVLPYGELSASGQVSTSGQTEPQVGSVTRSGFGDPALRLAVNLYGAPALPMERFREYRQDTIVGTSLAVTAPWGQYDGSKLVNIGTNRWSFKPEVGVSQAFGAWILEGSFGVTFFTANDDFFGGHTRKQDPLYAVQAHAIYYFNPGLWAALDATYYAGGRTTVDGVLNNDLQQNSRWGGTLGTSLDLRNSLKFYFNSGVVARTGTKFQTAGLAWQHLWGGGL
jgi:outer membrane putative beta-barrel porin/alpha-amylase